MSFYLSPRVGLSVEWDEASVDLVKLCVLGRVGGNPGAQLDRFLKVFLTVVPIRVFLSEYSGMIAVPFFVDFFFITTFHSFLGQRVFQLRHIKCSTVHWRASGPFWHAFGIPWLCYFAWWAEKLAKQTNSLPISARLKQPSLMQGGQKRRRRGPVARQGTVPIQL